MPGVHGLHVMPLTKKGRQQTHRLLDAGVLPT